MRFGSHSIDCLAVMRKARIDAQNAVSSRSNQLTHADYTFFYKKPIALAEPRGFLKFQFLNLIFS